MFNYDDEVRVIPSAPDSLRPGHKAWVIGITTQEMRLGTHFEQFPAGTVYLVEFEDGEATDIHESMLTSSD